jgi:molecular chaperone GrpE
VGNVVVFKKLCFWGNYIIVLPLRVQKINCHPAVYLFFIHSLQKSALNNFGKLFAITPYTSTQKQPTMMHNKDEHTHSEEWNEENSEMSTDFDGTDSDNLTDEDAPIENEFDALQEKYDKLSNSYLRLSAEFDNYRKRTMKEKADIIKSGCERVLLDVISLVDDFERAQTSLKGAENKYAILEGMELIHQKFENFLKQHGVKEIEAVGLPFDPDRFEAVTTIPVEDNNKKGTVIDCVQKGYEMSDKIIRFPKVIVGE